MKTKLVYQLDQYGVLMGEIEALESPLEPGVFHLPAGCIDPDVPFPENVGLDQYVFWKDGNWWVADIPPDPNAPTLASIAREWRNAELARADIVLLKVQDGMPNLGSVGEWRKYRVALRMWPEATGFPSPDSRPLAPDYTEEV